MRVIVFFVLILSTCADAQECVNKSVRIVEGHEPIASSLYEAAKTTDMGAWDDGEFHTETFSYIGELEFENEKLYVSYLYTVWGSSCRATSRLIFWNTEFKQVGQYVSIEKPHFIAKNTLSIPYEEEPESIWKFTGDLPACLEVANDCFPLQNQNGL
ncbi:hypothetical protein [Alteromonas sp. S167]|uniref:hypothetical protein n=1 Tax=Alteromonas sp. S167 TaxID=3117402 RepID=UPI002FE18779